MNKLTGLDLDYMRAHLNIVVSSAETAYKNLLEVNKMLGLLEDDCDQDEEPSSQDPLVKALACLAVAKGLTKDVLKESGNWDKED